MALKRNERYPGRFANPSTAHPQGAFQNRTSPTSQDGSYLEADWANDIDGFFARIINVAGITLNGTVDDGTASQLYDALVTAMPGRLLGAPKRITSNGTYTPSAGTKTIIVEQVGGGAGGTPAAASSSTVCTYGGGGGSGAYAKYIITSVPSSVAVTVGSAGPSGTVGGSTSFGSYCTSAGGSIGQNGSTTSSGVSGGGNGAALPSVSGATAITLSAGNPGTFAIAVSIGGGNGGYGGSTPLGSGGKGSPSSTGVSASGYGAGGGGPFNPSTGNGGVASVVAGGAAAPGVVIVWEYS